MSWRSMRHMRQAKARRYSPASMAGQHGEPAFVIAGYPPQPLFQPPTIPLCPLCRRRRYGVSSLIPTATESLSPQTRRWPTWSTGSACRNHAEIMRKYGG
jgi:hypothetical protein